MEKSRRRVIEHKAIIDWQRTSPNFTNGEYSRLHTLIFDGGISIPGSPSPHVVKAPWSSEQAVDPEEAFVASVAACHMLTFLYLAAKAGWIVDKYHDEAAGEMTKNDQNIPWVSHIRLRPNITWGGTQPPSAEQIEELHHAAHSQCFIANSVKTKIEVVA